MATTKQTPRVTCPICKQRTRNLDKHNAEQHASASTVQSDAPSFIVTNAETGESIDMSALVAHTAPAPVVVEELESALTPDASSGVEPVDLPSAIESLDAQPTPEVVTPKGSIMDRAVCLSVRRGRFGNSRKASTSMIEVNADKSMLALSKRLLSSKELQDVRALDNEVFHYLYAVALPSMFKGGVYLVPIPMVASITEELNAYATRREELVEKFVASYPAAIEATKLTLRDLYNPRDYPDTTTLRAMFYFEWQWVTFGVPGTLKQISESIFQQESEKAAAKVQAAAEECRQAIRAGMLDLVENMVERLTPTEDGKKRIFRNSLVENMNAFLKTFDMRDITDDSELGAVVQKARDIMSGVDAETLRSDEGLRDAIKSSFVAVKDSLAGMVTEKTRRITFDDEASAA